jgi:D-3-phosphoglycerate dehydrogenase
LGRSAIGGEAIALLYVDAPIPRDVIRTLEGTGQFTQVKPLAFDVTQED